MAEATTAAPSETSAPANGAAPAVTAKPGEKAAPVAAEATQEFIVNGKPVKLTAAQVKAAVQKGLFADQTLKSVDVLKKSSAALLNQLKSDPLSVLTDKSLGANPKEAFKKFMSSDLVDDEMKEFMSKWVYDNVVQTSKLTPEQIEEKKKLSDYERLKAQEEKRRNDEAKAKLDAQTAQIRGAIKTEVSKQIVADKTFPQTEGSVRAVFEKLRVMNKKGVPIDSGAVTKALDLVKKDHILNQQTLFDAIEDPEALISYFGEARALKISRALVARLKAKGKVTQKEAAATETDAPREKITDKLDREAGRTRHGYQVMKF